MLNIKQKLYPYYWSWLSRWLDKRQPAANSITLRQRIIFILPTRFGVWFGFLCVLLYLLGTNYQNNLILLVCYLLLSIWLVGIVLAFGNLNGLTLSASSHNAGFANQDIAININTFGLKPHYMIQFQFVKQPQTVCKPSLESSFSLTLFAPKRGLYPLPRLKVSSCYPFGLWRSWSYVAFKQQYWVYPNPITTVNNLYGQSATTAASYDSEISQDLRQYQTGDSLNQILWKRLARDSSRPIVRLRQPIQHLDPCWVSIPDLTGSVLEQALSYASDKLLTLEANGQVYGLKLKNFTLAPAQGSLHLQRCLQQLALYS